MFTVWFARGYANEECITTTEDEEEARIIADAEYACGARDITVEDAYGAVVYQPDEETFLVDEY